MRLCVHGAMSFRGVLAGGVKLVQYLTGYFNFMANRFMGTALKLLTFTVLDL